MNNRLCCKNCKYCKDFMVNGNVNTFCTMFNEIFGNLRIDIIEDINNHKCEMFEDVEENILGVVENEN